MTASIPAVGQDEDLPSAFPANKAATTGVTTSPVLRLESGTHAFALTAAAADAACRYVATASLDKTVRIWDTATGKALAVLRPPIGLGGEGELMAVAVSPDGSLVACGGDTGYGSRKSSTFVFDRATGKVARRIESAGALVEALAFSRDGKYLAIGTDEDLSVFRASDGQMAGEDDEPGGAVSAIQFAAPDHEGAPLRLACCTGNGVHLYKFLETAVKPLRSVARYGALDSYRDPNMQCLAFSPDCTQIAVGDNPEPAITILSGDDLTALETHQTDDFSRADDPTPIDDSGLEDHPYRAPAAAPATGIFDCVYWSGDGRLVYGAGTAPDGEKESIIYRWRIGQKAAPVRIASGVAALISLIRPPAAGVIFSATGLPLGLLGGDGHRTLYHRFPLMRNQLPGDLLASADGYTVAFPPPNQTPSSLIQSGQATSGQAISNQAPSNQALLRFRLDAHLLTATSLAEITRIVPPLPSVLPAPLVPLAPPIVLAPPILARPGVSVQTSTSGDDTKPSATLNGKDVPLSPYEPSFCEAIAPDEQSFVIGTASSLQCFTQDQDQLWTVTTPGAVRKVNIVQNGKVAVAALGDGTIRWYRLTDGLELCALYVDEDQTRWVAWTPANDYDVSPGGEELFGWHVNHGLDQATDFYPGTHFHSDHYKSDLFAQVLDTAKIPDTAKALDAALPQSSPETRSADAGKAPSAIAADAERLRHHADLQAALEQAVGAGDVSRARTLLASGASPNDKFETGATLLTVAATQGRTALVALLLAAGAKVNTPETNSFAHTRNMTTLMYVAITGNTAVAKLLLNAGAEVNARDSDGQTPLGYAATSGAGAAMVGLLKRAGGRP